MYLDAFVKCFKTAEMIYMCECLQVLAEKVHIRALTIAQRVQLLQDGLNDRSGVYCGDLALARWWRTCMVLRVAQNEEIFEKCLPMWFSFSSKKL